MAVNGKACVILWVGGVQVCGHMDRQELEMAYGRIGVALRELDIREGKGPVPDEGMCDLGGNPFECAHQR